MTSLSRYEHICFPLLSSLGKHVHPTGHAFPIMLVMGMGFPKDDWSTGAESVLVYNI
jgi:hypothetical protein